jgi:hypothetical protein
MLDMLRSSLHHVLTESSTRPFAERLAELGWDEVLADDPSAALRTLFEVKGDTLSNADALSAELARGAAEANGAAALATAAVGLASPYGHSIVTADGVTIDVVLLAPPAGRPIVTVVGDHVAVVRSDGLRSEPLGGIDPELGAVRVTGTATDVTRYDGRAWATVVARGRWLLACELVGIARHVVAAAVDYTKQRVQYGKPIGVFQALQHRLAGAHSMVVGAAHLAAEAGDDGDEWTAIVAKCMAGQAAEFACVQAQQSYGAIGFTWEHEFHRYLRRTYALDSMLGDWRTLEHEIGARLQATGTVPRIGGL